MPPYSHYYGPGSRYLRYITSSQLADLWRYLMHAIFGQYQGGWHAHANAGNYQLVKKCTVHTNMQLYNP